LFTNDQIIITNVIKIQNLPLLIYKNWYFLLLVLKKHKDNIYYEYKNYVLLLTDNGFLEIVAPDCFFFKFIFFLKDNNIIF